jgi:hypothetical protein
MTLDNQTETYDLTDKPLADVQAQIARVDTKASILTGLALAALTGGTALAGKAHLHGVALAAAVVTALLVGAALTLLGAAIRPALGGNYGFVRWAAPTASDLFDDLSTIDHAEAQVYQLWMLSWTVRRKYRRVRLAVDLLGCALATTAITAILSALD